MCIVHTYSAQQHQPHSMLPHTRRDSCIMPTIAMFGAGFSVPQTGLRLCTSTLSCVVFFVPLFAKTWLSWCASQARKCQTMQKLEIGATSSSTDPCLPHFPARHPHVPSQRTFRMKSEQLRQQPAQKMASNVRVRYNMQLVAAAPAFFNDSLEFEIRVFHFRVACFSYLFLV